MATVKSASEMTLGELEKALNVAKERLSGMEKELADYRKTVQQYLLEFSKRQRHFEKSLGLGDESFISRRAPASGRRRARKGTVAEGILAVLAGSKTPLKVDDIVTATGASSKPSIAQTLMKLVQAGKVQRFNRDGKAIKAGDDSQRAKSYSIA